MGGQASWNRPLMTKSRGLSGPNCAVWYKLITFNQPALWTVIGGGRVKHLGPVDLGQWELGLEPETGQGDSPWLDVSMRMLSKLYRNSLVEVMQTEQHQMCFDLKAWW